MFNSSMYGSPFPAINPKVRYKTALERAGFDTNFNGTCPKSPPNERRNVSAAFQQPPQHKYMEQTRVYSLPVHRPPQSRPTPSPTPTPPPVPIGRSTGRNSPAPHDSLSRHAQGSFSTTQMPYAGERLPQNLSSTSSLPMNPVHSRSNDSFTGGNTYMHHQNRAASGSIGSVSTRSFSDKRGLNVRSKESLGGFREDHSNEAQQRYDHGVSGQEKELLSKTKNLDNWKRESFANSQSSSRSGAVGSFSKDSSQEPNRGPNSSAFDFEISHSQRSSGVMNPIEKSFMMLTQNGFSHSDKSESLHSDLNSDVNSMHTASKSLEEELDLAPSSELHVSFSQKTNPLDVCEEDGDQDSVNFQPCAELDIDLPTAKDNKPLSQGELNSIINEQASVVSSLKISASGDKDERKMSQEQLMVPSEQEQIDHKRISPDHNYNRLGSFGNNPIHDESESKFHEKERIQDSAVYDNRDDENAHTTIDVSASQTATSLQVEQLLAQLNDVSEHKNAQVDSFSHPIDSDFNSDVIRNSAKSRPLLTINSQPNYKKSSAYLSGYQMNNIPQTINIDDDCASATSKVGDTPLFYKFREHPLKDFARSEENIPEESIMENLDGKQNLVFIEHHIEPLQLRLKTSTEMEEERIKNQQSDNLPVITVRDESIAKDNLLNVDISNDTGSKHKSVFKFPPGEGPCRLCGQEVNKKPIFSKKENELSGQWHRDCFRCLKCNVRFNKQTPCYILADQPYCQQHYHEENNSICKICHGFIEGECLENDRDERFHVSCLTCFLCKAVISNDYFMYNEEFPLCGHHEIDALIKDDTIDPNNGGNFSRRRTRLINFSPS